MTHSISRALAVTISAAALMAGLSTTAYADSLFSQKSPRPNSALPAHVASSMSVKVNRRALNAPTMDIDLFGETVTATRTHIDRQKGGTLIWTGHIGGNPNDLVVVTARGNAFSARVDYQGRSFQLTGDRRSGTVFNEIDYSGYPEEEPLVLPDGGGASNFDSSGFDAATAADAIQQDLLIAYTDDACVAVGGTSGADCSQIEADILAAVADMNASYVASNINISMNLVGMIEVDYVEDGKSISTMLSELRSTSDGIIDNVHTERDELGADLVGLVTASGGGFCGVGYRPASPSSAFNVTAEFCLTNRTLAHELGHNQGSLHDRAQHSGGTSGAYNYGYRRCNDGSIDDFGSPYFRTTMAYGCTSASRVARFSNPNVNYLGVPSGVDPAVDPAKGAWSARTLNESAAYVASFRDAPVQTTPPAAPSGLSASASGPDTVNLSWTDNADNETSFTLQRSLDNTSWSSIATLGTDATSFNDNGLDADTTYFYRVRAENSAGSSSFSNAASATTESLPATIDDVAIGQILGSGVITGGFTATHADDSSAQTITEQSTGGPKRSRRQAFIHTWTFDVTGGAGGVSLAANAWVSGSEGANFSFSTDGGATYNQMFTVNDTDPGATYAFVFPGGTSGAVRIQARDAEQLNGEGVDSLNVDSLIITSNTEVGSPPAAPSNMTASAVSANQVELTFMDNSEDEFGFDILRATSDPQGNCNAGASVGSAASSAGTGSVSYSDDTAAPSTTYWYWAQSFNGAGDNGQCSNSATATTLAAPDITLTASGYKVKGRQTVDLSWSGANGSNVDIRRNGALIASTANDGAYTDNIGIKGGGSYSYEVCESGSTETCSPAANVVF